VRKHSGKTYNKKYAHNIDRLSNTGKNKQKTTERRIKAFQGVKFEIKSANIGEENLPIKFG